MVYFLSLSSYTRESLEGTSGSSWGASREALGNFLGKLPWKALETLLGKRVWNLPRSSPGDTPGDTPGDPWSSSIVREDS